MIGHALTVAERPLERANWDRSIAYAFAFGSACFFVAPFPGFLQLIGPGADGMVFFVGSLFFTFAAGLELNTLNAMRDGLSTEQEDRLVFAPDLFGSACFLISGVLAYRAGASTMAAVNLAGCVLFGISAIASYIVPSTGTVLDLAAVNWCTSLGALCFLIGALMLLPRKSTAFKEA